MTKINISLIKLVQSKIYENEILANIITSCYGIVPDSFSFPFATIEIIKNEIKNSLSLDFQETTLEINLCYKDMGNEYVKTWCEEIEDLFNMKVFEEENYEHCSLVQNLEKKFLNKKHVLSTVVNFLSEVKI